MSSADLALPLVLLFDDDCELCRRFQRWVSARDRLGLVESAPLSMAELETRFPQLDLERARAHLTVCSETGGIHEGLAALRQIGLRLPAMRRLVTLSSSTASSVSSW